MQDVRIAVPGQAPIAVESMNFRPAIDFLTAGRSNVGDTNSFAWPPNSTSPRSIFFGSSPANEEAADLAAAIRLGSTSVACMDGETSIAIITVARSCGTRTAVAGRATPNERTVSAMSSSANVRCRRHPGRRGATLPSSSTLLNRATKCLRRSCTTT